MQAGKEGPQLTNRTVAVEPEPHQNSPPRTAAGFTHREILTVLGGLMLGMLLALADYQKPDLRDRRPAGLWDAYIRVDGVHALYQIVDGKPFIQMPLTHRSYGDWEFEVRDPNGYVLVFGGAY